VRDILQKHPGNSEVILIVITSTDDVRGRYVSQKPIEQKVAVNRDLLRDLTEALGEGQIRLIADLKKRSSNGQGVGR
jgi:hypothetical protein